MSATSSAPFVQSVPFVQPVQLVPSDATARPTEWLAPGVFAPTLAAPRTRDLCTDCGLSRTADAARCGQACQFLRPRYAELERRVHGRPRDPARADELHFGPYLQMFRARLRVPAPGAQWTGIATRLGERLLETGTVDAVLATAADPGDRWKPRPVIVTRPEGMAACRGMKMGFSPLLALLEPARRAGHRRLAVIGIPCQVHALRAIERELGLDALYVVGTPCSDNTTTERFHHFLGLLTDRAEDVTYLEFRTDYRVELRFRDGGVRYVPFLELPISQLPDDFIPLTCRSCMDYTNALADLTVGYLGGDGQQWLLVRNERGRALVDVLGTELEQAAVLSSGRRQRPVQGFLDNLQRAAGGLPVRRMPAWLRPLVGRLQRRFGPRGLEFARARVEMKAVEGIVMLRRNRRRRLRSMVPPSAWALARPYGLVPAADELDPRAQETASC